jgi:copper-exporting ATPase
MHATLGAGQTPFHYHLKGRKWFLMINFTILFFYLACFIFLGYKCLAEQFRGKFDHLIDGDMRA